MASAITETDTYPTSVTGPDDGDSLSVAQVRSAIGAVASRTKNIRDHLVAAIVTTAGGSSTSVTIDYQQALSDGTNLFSGVAANGTDLEFTFTATQPGTTFGCVAIALGGDLTFAMRSRSTTLFNLEATSHASGTLYNFQTGSSRTVFVLFFRN